MQQAHLIRGLWEFYRKGTSEIICSTEEPEQVTPIQNSIVEDHYVVERARIIECFCHEEVVIPQVEQLAAVKCTGCGAFYDKDGFITDDPESTYGLVQGYLKASPDSEE